MGCVFSKHFGDTNPRFFQVWNVDDHGNQLNPGKIEVTRLDLVLHQKGKTPIRWPLRCLRRYGFDAELFSFESGRRCPTGPGIYAFKCRQAETLFNTVQEFIQCRSSAVATGNASSAMMTSPSTDERLGSIFGMPTMPNSVSSNTVASYNPPLVSNGVGAIGNTIGPTGPLLPSGLPAPMSVDNVGYLEPIGISAAVAASQPRSGSLGSMQSAQQVPGQLPPPNAVTAPGEAIIVTNNNIAVSPARNSLPGIYNPPGGIVPPTTSVSGTCSCSACTALTRAAAVTSAVVPNPVVASLPHQYVNSSVVVVPEKSGGGGGTAASRDPFYVNGQLPCLAPPPSTMAYVDQNTNYARLDDLFKQEQQNSAAKRQKDNNRFYENVTPEPAGITVKNSTNRVGGTPQISRSNTVTSPTIPKSPVVHFYANLNSPPTMEPLEPGVKGQEEMTDASCPDLLEDEPRVNYITLDLNHSQPSTDMNEVTASSPPATGLTPNLGLSPPGSPGNPTEGYATIDFDKTAALSNSSNNPSILDDSVRKTRHNSAVPVPLTLTFQ